MKKSEEVQANEFIRWADKDTGIIVFGQVLNVLTQSVVVAILGTNHRTVVSFKRLEVVGEEDVDETAGERLQRTHRAMGSSKWL